MVFMEIGEKKVKFTDSQEHLAIMVQMDHTGKLFLF